MRLGLADGFLFYQVVSEAPLLTARMVAEVVVVALGVWVWNWWWNNKGPGTWHRAAGRERRVPAKINLGSSDPFNDSFFFLVGLVHHVALAVFCVSFAASVVWAVVALVER